MTGWFGCQMKEQENSHMFGICRSIRSRRTICQLQEAVCGSSDTETTGRYWFVTKIGLQRCAQILVWTRGCSIIPVSRTWYHL